MARKQLMGIVVSNKMLKTLVVRVEKIKKHLKYKKHYRVHQKYKAHYDQGEYKIGDKITIEECRPISKDKRWKIIKKL